MRQEAAAKRDPTQPVQDLDDSDDMKLDSILIDIVCQNIDTKMSKGDPEYKIFKENYHRILPYFTERLKHIPDDLLHEIFSELDDRLEEIVSILNKNLWEFCDLSQFICKCLSQLNPLNVVENIESTKDSNIFLLLTKTLAQIGNKLLNFDPMQTEIYFLEYTIDDLIEIIEKNMFKRNEMMYLFYCFVSQTVNSHLRVLMRLKDKIKNKDVYYYCISKLLKFENESETEGLDPDLYNFYIQSASLGLMSTSPITKTKCISILSYLSNTNAELITTLLPRIEPLVFDSYWELQGQILILCGNCLHQFNNFGEDNYQDTLSGLQEAKNIKGTHFGLNNGNEASLENSDNKGQIHYKNVSGSKSDQLHSNLNGKLPSEKNSPRSHHKNNNQQNEEENGMKRPREVEEEQKSAFKEERKINSPTHIKNENADDQLGTTSQQETILRLSEEYTPLLFGMIEAIFKVSAPKATLKIGLIYLAKILHYYPEFTDLYLQILLSVPDAIRTSVVEWEPLMGTEDEVYVSGWATDRYLTFGAPLEWNPLYVAQSLERHIKDKGIESIEWQHLEIFEAWLKLEFEQEDIERWLEIFNSLKSFFFISLCSREFSNTTIEILKKIYTNPQMQEKFISESKSIFVKIMKLIYQPDVDIEWQQNIREFLDYLHNCEESTPELKKMVYDVIKKFADNNKEAFQNSNLIDLTVNVVDIKRGIIFKQ
jgi:hypothetical protein